jgi:hypothetical protein
MAFPAVAAVEAAATAGNSTTHVSNLPAGIQAGEQLIVCVANDGGGSIAAYTWPAGWTEICVGHPSGQAVRAEARYRIADGSEGSTISITGNSEAWVSHSWRITGHSGAAPEAGTPATGTSGNANPPTCTPSWGAKDTLWIVFAGFDNLQSGVSAYPTNYDSNQRQTISGGAGGFSMCASATRELNATDDNPDTFTNTSDDWVAFTIAVEPEAAAVAGGGVTTLTRRRRR